ncbi:MAG: hypothetical protein U1E65_05190 [Myxococcota bacterium]
MILGLLLLSAPAPADFNEEARLLWRVAACADEDDRSEHCQKLRPKIELYRRQYIERAGPFLAELSAGHADPRVVYPFGGGDLLSALTTFEDAREWTTMSLEHAGDPRRARGLEGKKLEESLAAIRESIDGLLTYDDSKTENLQRVQKGEIPGQITFFLVALVAHGFEPVSLRYFRVEDDGSLHYFTLAEIEALEKTKARRLHRGMNDPDFSEAFSNAELGFRRRGDPEGPLLLHRHLAADLSDGALKRRPGILKHLEEKGPVRAMTKAASYLLWRQDFSAMRGYLLRRASLMISDSTGIPPKLLPPGVELNTYGGFTGSFLDADPALNESLRKAYETGPPRALPFRYGYLDAAKKYHLMVWTRSAE